MRLRVLTFNVQNGAGELDRAALVNAELRRLQPDIVALQEVGYPGERDVFARMLDGTGLHGTHQADVLADVPEYADRFGGTAVATRWAHVVLEAVDQRLPEAPRLPHPTRRASATSAACSRCSAAVRTTTTPGRWRATADRDTPGRSTTLARRARSS